MNNIQGLCECQGLHKYNLNILVSQQNLVTHSLTLHFIKIFIYLSLVSTNFAMLNSTKSAWKNEASCIFMIPHLGADFCGSILLILFNICVNFLLRNIYTMYVCMYKGWAHRSLHRDLQWSVVLPLLFVPSAILRFERNAGSCTWGRRNSHLVP
jgi:hypothetical protein